LLVRAGGGEGLGGKGECVHCGEGGSGDGGKDGRGGEGRC
jgi:hypothetical protein